MPIHRGVKTLLIAFLIVISSSLFADTPLQYPTTSGTELLGFASWYGGKFHGRLTSSGEVFDTNDMTAAHKTLPFGTIVRVTNQDNGRTALVKINDRGPFVEGRIIDLSRAAAERLDMVGQGVARVALDIVEFVTDKDLYAVQVGAYALEGNAEKARATLEAAGFVVTVERNTLGVARVSARAIAGRDLPDSRKKLEGLGFSSYLVKKEKTEAPRLSRRTGAGTPTSLITSP
jgi:rare lipoprotein A